ncbi:integrase arm-type DNA-binding domain-containing protein [Alsobacter sp. KACC 23698]|uniref:Integrase arm-type DNA-binding domain-containing protein n=1 Tax=Alsobacter sp. KACC 23698 TaxID=3149229 RepID=A0AAU7JBB4_9HYPH
MARPEKMLSARTVATAKEPGRYADGGGLYLSVSTGGAKSWVFMWKAGGKRTEIGLGSLTKVSLASARERAALAREAVGDGRDPRAILKPAGAVPTFGEEADTLIASMAANWRNAKHKAQWEMTLREYAKSLRSLPVNQVTTEHVLAVLKPLWTSRHETASRLRGRIEAVLAASTAKGHRSGPNPAQWRHHIDKLLPKRGKLQKGHYAAMAFGEVPALIVKLRAAESVAAAALEFTILTAARSGEVLGARWSEVDLRSKIWTVPAGRMKAGKEHRVPLSHRAVDILTAMQRVRTERNEHVFPGRRAERGLSVTALEMALRRLKVENATVHGFRSSFRDWVGEATDFQRDVAEMALAHRVGDEVERAYRRGDALKKRRIMMDSWAEFLGSAWRGSMPELQSEASGED